MLRLSVTVGVSG